MNVLWPGSLFLLGGLPLLVALYLWALRRRRRYALRYSSLSLIREAMPQQSRLRRHLPFAMFLLALTGLILALARPVAAVTVPVSKVNILLTIDVSRSMLQEDIPPSRLRAAQDAALQFIDSQDAATQIGIVAFARFGQIIQSPTTDRRSLHDAVERLTPGRGTAIGSGILQSLQAISELNSNVAPVEEFSSSGDGGLFSPVPEGSFVPDIIVLLTDGVSTGGTDPVAAADAAAERGVRIYTIGFGTDMGDATWGWGGQRGSQDPADPSGGQGWGGRFRRGIDEDTLKLIAEMTGGEYYAAESASELQSVFRELPSYLMTRQETIEISVAFAAVGAVLAAAAVLLSWRWTPFP